MKKILLFVGLLLFTISVSAVIPEKVDSLVRLQEVIVSANKIQVNRNNIPLTISIIGREQIEASSESALLPV